MPEPVSRHPSAENGDTTKANSMSRSVGVSPFSPPLTVVKLPSGHSVSLARRFGELEFQVDVDAMMDPNLARMEPDDRKAWKGIDCIARLVREIDGKKVERYSRDKLIRDFDARDLSVLIATQARLVAAKPEDLVNAWSEFESKDALAESLKIFHLSGGAIAFETAMLWPDVKRRVVCSGLESELSALQQAQPQASEPRVP